MKMRSSTDVLVAAWSDERGQTVVLGALLMTVLLGFLAFSVDTGVLFYQQREQQTATDSAAIAGALELNYGTFRTAAKADASRNGFTDGAKGVTVTVNNPPQSGPHTSSTNYVEVIITSAPSTFFARALGKKTVSVKTRAVAALGGTTQNCIYALAPTGIDYNLSNGVHVDTGGCSIFGDSSSSSALSAIGGAHLTAGSIGLVGGASINNGASVSPTPTTGMATISDPLGYLQPPSYSSCQADPVNGAWGTYTIGPAGGGTICYNGLNIANSATVTLRPGVYVINGTLTLAGGTTTSGTGVSFYLPPGAGLSISNGIKLNVSAPTSGAYNGILFYQDRANTTSESIEGGADLDLQGILYFPSANLTFENGTNTATYAAVIASTLTFSGGTKVQNYSTVNSSSPLAGARVVE